MEIIRYSLLSLVLALLTEGVLFGGIYLIIKIVNPDYIDKLLGTFTRDNVNNTSLNPNSPIYNNQSGPSSNIFEEYRFREDISISIRFNREMFIALLVLALVIGLVLFILYFLLFTRKFSKQQYNISYGIQEISEGNFKHRIPVESLNEFGEIAINLNKMAYKLEQIIIENNRNEKNKNALITSLAHDIRTPLTSINGYLDLLVNKANLSGETRQHYENIVYKKSKELEHLIEDLFDYTRVSLGEVSINNTTINMVQFVNQLLDEFYPSFHENDLEYTVEIQGNDIYIEGDGDLLARAISNLIGNAIKYGKDGKMVNIYLKKENDNVVFQIVNYGELIPEESMPHLFERFYRVEDSRSSETGGTGLGLSIAKEIIETHNGTINARSDYNGTVFEVILPGKGGEDNE